MEPMKTYNHLIWKDNFKQRIVICGSMSFYGDMLEIQNSLRENGIPSIVPVADEQYYSNLSDESFAAFKCKVSFQYLRKIRSPETIAILAVNRDKHGIHDYIGPNTFAEIAVAFAQSKRIFLLQGMPQAYEDELSSWGVISLDGSLPAIYNYYKSINSNQRQLSLFQDL